MKLVLRGDRDSKRVFQEAGVAARISHVTISGSTERYWAEGFSRTAVDLAERHDRARRTAENFSDIDLC